MWEETLKMEFHSTLNGANNLSDYSDSSAKKVWWQCSVNERHVWEARVFARRKQNQGCPYCKGKKVLPEDSLAAKHPELLTEWNYEKNKLDPITTHCSSGKKVWWKCNKGHEWETMIVHRSGNGTGCPYCCNQKTTLDSSIASTHPYLLREWDYEKNGELLPTAVVAKSHRNVWWKCPKGPDHEWQAMIFNRVNGSQCPCCQGRKTVLSNCLATTDPLIAQEWHPTKNEITPYEVCRASNSKFWFRCSENSSHEWFTFLCCRTRAKNPSGCPFCASSKGEKAIKACLESMGLEFQREYIIDECRNIRPLPFDFAIFDGSKLLALIEFQGRHHYMPISYFGGEEGHELVKKHDKIKKAFCKEHGVPLLAIHFEKMENIGELIQIFIDTLLSNL